MGSPPPTPPATMSRSKTQRFIDTAAPCEYAECYRPGGFHPVHLGDLFKNDQYRVLRKLGDGANSTVWLAMDAKNSRYVALKIVVAKASDSVTSELSIYSHLADRTAKDPFSAHILMPLDNFEHVGPNGKHHCLVFEPMGPSTASMAEELPENEICERGKVAQYPKWLAKRILKHALFGLAFLHKNGVIHGDFQPGNLLFSTVNLDQLDELQLQQDRASIRYPLERIDGKEDRWAPKHLILGESLHKFTILGPETFIKISDLGAAFRSENPPKSPLTPIGLRAPELIIEESFGSAIDIWSFGCLVYEFLTGTALFAVGYIGYEDKDDVDDDHLLALNDILEPLPDSWLSKWPRSQKWLGPNRERLQPGKSAEGIQALEDGKKEIEEQNGGEGLECNEGPYIEDPLEVLFDRNKQNDIDAEEAKVVTTLIRQILRYEPSERPSAQDILEHPWFQD